jgi:hypothetical protein
MRPLLVLVLGLATTACGASQRAADTDWSPEPERKEKHLRVTESLGNPQPLEEVRPPALLGVRHDLMLSNAPHPERCTCLSVEVGRPADARFFWAGGAPDVGPDALIIALGARGIPCPGGDPDDRRRRPSISAVEQLGEDIVVEVEDLPEGRPLASGAIIPRAGARGGIYVVPRRGNALYGRAPAGGRCRVQ